MVTEGLFAKLYTPNATETTEIGGKSEEKCEIHVEK